jgi:signal transduction histidine kinase
MTELKGSTVAALLRLSALETTNWEDLLEQILKVDSETLRVDRVSYWSIRSEPRQLFCDLGYQADRDEFERGALLAERAFPRYFEAICDLQLIDVADVENDRRATDLRPYLLSRGIGALLDVPIWVGGKVVGVLCHEHVGSTREWTKADREFVLSIGQVVVASLQARERTRAELAERRSVFLHQAAARLSSTLDVSETERIAVRRALPTLGDAAVLDVSAAGSLHRVAMAHLDAQQEVRLHEVWQRFAPTVGGPQVSQLAVRLKSSILIPDVARRMQAGEIDEDYGQALLGLRIRSVIVVPIRHSQLGGAMVFCSTRGTYQQADLRLAEEYTALVSSALENAHLFNRAQQAVQARDEFISLASHELRTPLTSLRASAEALASGLAPATDIDSVAEAVVRQVDRLDRLARRMIDTVEVRSGTFTIHYDRTDLVSLVRRAASDLSSTLRRAGCSLDLRADGAVVGAWDAPRLETVIDNLLENAAKFGKGKPIDVEVGTHDDMAVLSVRDHGAGLPPELEGDLFARYQRGARPPEHGGLGLGLYVVRGIVDAHGGSARAIRNPDGGTTITVELPRGQIEEEA